jgi:SRSO17 transposase
MGLLRSCFARTQTWLQAGKYLNALVSELPSRNSWSAAEHAGDRSPDRSQRLLNRASWDERAAMSLVRKYAAAGLDDAARRSRRRRMTAGVLDETGHEKQGSSTAGVKRQYMGCAGRVANGVNTVHLSYVREKTGHALVGARQWIPAEDIKDPVKSLVAGLPLDLRFRSKGGLAVDILGDAYADGLAFDFVCGDEVYGNCTELREQPAIPRSRPRARTRRGRRRLDDANQRRHHHLRPAHPRHASAQLQPRPRTPGKRPPQRHLAPPTRDHPPELGNHSQTRPAILISA